MPLPPKTEQELMQRAEKIVARSFASLAHQAGIIVPENLKREKGWVGQLLEWHLGAESGSKAQPDFEHLGIELKTIPIGFNGQPLETTFISVAPLTGVNGLTWQNSHVKHKLAKVLWIPVEGERDIPLAERRVGRPILWSPSAQEEQQLQQDWEELMEFIVLGKVEQITAKHGEVMQLRPKAANSKVVTEAYSANGQPIKALPRGFYLRKQFTANILLNHLQRSS
ncbi:DNA mismatch repair endonuclease MutH [Vibrio sp. E150_018]